MSEALEALKTLRENIRSEDGQIWRKGIRDNDKTRAALTVLMDFASAALEQPSTGEARALADYAVFIESGEEWNQLSVWLPLCDAQNYLRSVGEHFPFACIFKRIREEG